MAEGDPTPQNQPPAPEPQGQQQPPQPAPEPTAQPEPQQQQAPTLEHLQQQLQAKESELQRARQDAAKYRTRNDQESQTLRSVHEALQKAGLIEGDQTDPAKLSQQLSSMQQENRQLRIDAMLGELSGTLGARPRLLRAVLLSEGALNDVDPTAPDFRDALEAAAKKAIEENPELRASQAPARTTSDGFNGQTQQPVTPAQFKEMDYYARARLMQQNPALYAQLAEQTR